MDEQTVLVESDGLEQVEDVLNGLFNSSKQRAASIGPGYRRLWETLEACTAGGKRFRPRMVMTAYELLGGRDSAAAAVLAASFELLHTALIIHDDVIDRDFVRRGIPNVSGTFRDLAEAGGSAPVDARHRGLSVGVIAGDLALSNAYRLLDTIQTDNPTRLRLARILDEAVFAAAGGEFLDVDTAGAHDAPPVAEVLQIARLKTAVYSFEGPLQAGAVLAGADERIVAALTDFGRDAGIAYQVADDLLGVFGNETSTGKTNWGDLREGKRTALIAYVATRPEWHHISALIGSPDMSAADAVFVRKVLVESGARDYSAGLAVDYANRARRHLEASALPTALRAGLESVATAVIERVR